MKHFSDKSALRKYAKSLRNDLPIDEYSSIIFEKLTNLIFYKEAKNIFIYSSFSSEIDTKKILSVERDKTFYLPKIFGDELEICKFEGFEKGNKNKYGIFEPDSEHISNVSVVDLAVIPALSADAQGYRLGYGKGFYDRFLPRLKRDCKKIILIPEELFFESIPHGDFDVRCDVIITQRNVINI